MTDASGQDYWCWVCGWRINLPKGWEAHITTWVRSGRVYCDHSVREVKP